MKTVRKFTQTQSTNWVFTLNNYTQEECDSLPDLINRSGVFERSNSLVKAIAVSEEIGERNGTPHLQGYLQLSKKGMKKVKHKSGFIITPDLCFTASAE